MAELTPTVTTLHPRRWGRRINRALILLVVGLIIAPGIWGYLAQRRIDALLDEYRVRGEPASLADLRGPIVPDEQNAVIELRAAAKQVQLTQSDFDFICDLELPLTPREMRLTVEFLDRYRPAIGGVRQAAQKTAFDWQVQWQSPVIDIAHPALNEQKDLVHVLRAAALWSHQHGNEQDALAHLEDVFFIARALEEYRGLIPQLVSRGTGMMAISALTHITPTLRIGEAASPSSLSRQQVRQLVGTLLDETGVTRSARRGLIDERINVVDYGTMFLDGRPSSLTSAARPNWIVRYTMRGLLLDDAHVQVRHLTAIATGLEEPSWPAFAQRVPAQPSEVTRHPRLHLFASITASSHFRLAENHYRAIAERRMAAIALAIRWWSVEHEGRFPASLDELVPSYLPAVPLDPFSADGKPIRYQPDPDRPILYSVGLNGVDDGGALTHPNRGMWEQPDAIVHLKRQPRPEPETEE